MPQMEILAGRMGESVGEREVRADFAHVETLPNVVVAGHSVGRRGERAAIAKVRDDARKKVDAANRVRYGAAEALIMRG